MDDTGCSVLNAVSLRSALQKHSILDRDVGMSRDTCHGIVLCLFGSAQAPESQHNLMTKLSRFLHELADSNCNMNSSGNMTIYHRLLFVDFPPSKQARPAQN